jgi:hypothetical protein
MSKNNLEEIKRVFNDIEFCLHRKEGKSEQHKMAENPFISIPTNHEFKRRLEEDKQLFLEAWSKIPDKEHEVARDITDLVIKTNDSIKKLDKKRPDLMELME